MAGYIGERAKRRKRNYLFFFIFIFIFIILYYILPIFKLTDVKPADNLLPSEEEIISPKIRITIEELELKVFDKDVFLEFPIFNGIHRFIPALFSGYGVKTYFINVDHRHRIHGYSKYGTFGRLFKGVNDLIRVAKIIKEFKRNRV